MNIFRRMLSNLSPYRFERIDYNTPYIRHEDWQTDIDEIFDRSSPDNLLIHVHGWLEGYKGGQNKSNYVGRELDRHGFDGQVLGFLWKSKTTWSKAKRKSLEVSRTLSEIIRRIISYRPSISLNVSSHSLGTRVALKSFSHHDLSVDNTILMGGSVENEMIGSGRGYDTEDIKPRSNDIHNFYSHNDEILKYAYTTYESGTPIGISRNPVFNNYMCSVDHHSQYYKNGDVMSKIQDLLSN